MPFEAVDPNFEQRTRESFGKQGIMGHIGATLDVVRPGHVEISLPSARSFRNSTASSMQA